eukprot:Gb_01369 [translate_table: standard]
MALTISGYRFRPYAHPANHIHGMTDFQFVLLPRHFAASFSEVWCPAKEEWNYILPFSIHGHVYPYFIYDNNRSISLDYALFKSSEPVVRDGDRMYKNLFDAIVDSLIAAMDKLGHPNIPIVVTETGWPSAGKDVANVDNARTYNNNLIKHVLSNDGTPRRPGSSIDTYIFAFFNENQKSGNEPERHWGLFYPNKTPVYPVNFTP